MEDYLWDRVLTMEDEEKEKKPGGIALAEKEIGDLNTRLADSRLTVIYTAGPVILAYK